MTNLPEIQTQVTEVQTTEIRPPLVYPIVSLALIGLAAFFLVYAFMKGSVTPLGAQVASAAIPTPIGALPLDASAAIVVDLQNGFTLYEKNADAQLPLASITKVALVLAVAEVLSSDAILTIPYDTAPVGSSQRLGKGERWSVRDIINFTLVASSNKGAEILADAADAKMRARYPRAPEGTAVLWRMNELAKELGLTHTYFLNVNGLDASETQAGSESSARDIAKLMAHAYTTYPNLFSGTAVNGLLLSAQSGDTTSAINTNEALSSIPGLIMGKTGFTDLAGGNLAVVFDVGLAHPVVAVVLGSSYDGRFTDIQHLVDAAHRSIAFPAN